MKKNFSTHESLITHIKDRQVWLLGIINNLDKDFHIGASFKRDENTLKNFISIYIEKGNIICTDGWTMYNYLNNPHSGYTHIIHVHGILDFGLGVESTSHIESIRAQIKAYLKINFHVTLLKIL